MADKPGDRSEVEEFAMEKETQEGGMHVETFDVDPVEEKKLIRKIDFNLIPILALLFFLAFIDRINIGNARIQGLEKDLHMKGHDFNIALFVFFIPYILLELPCNLIIKKSRPSIYLSVIMTGWGIATVCQGVTSSFAGLVVCRVVIGIFEAGLLPGCIYVITMYYKRHEAQTRVSTFFSASIIAGAVSGLLAYAIAHMDGVAGYAAWRWIFIIEGIITIILAVAAYWFIPDWPETAKFLKENERTFLIRRLRADIEDAQMSHWNKKAARRVFSDVKIYLGIAMYIGVVTTTYSGSFFTPTILKQLGWTSVKAQVMSIPIYMVGCVFTITVAYISDRMRHRYGFVILGSLVSSVGYIILLNMHRVPVGARYLAIFLFLGGGWVVQTLIMVLLSNNVAGHYKRGAATGMQIGIGNIAGLIATNIYIPSEAPEYTLGFGLGLGLLWGCALAATVMVLLLRRENKLRDAGGRDYRYNLPDDERNNLGDDHPAFRFTY